MNQNVIVVAAVNDEQLLKSNLAASPVLAEGRWPLVAQRRFRSASQAYNDALERASGAIVIFAHQDVYFPRGWDRTLYAIVDDLDRTRTEWGVLGVWGMTSDGCTAGRIWCNGAGREYSGEAKTPAEVVCLDEVVLIVDSKRDLRFDDRLPGWHLYGADVVLEASRRGLKAMAVSAPVVHNTRTVVRLTRDYRSAYRYMQVKWAELLPLRTCLLAIGSNEWPIHRRNMQMTMNHWIGRWPVRSRRDRGCEIAASAGYESPMRRK